MENGVKKNGLYVLLFVNTNIKGSESIKKGTGSEYMFHIRARYFKVLIQRIKP